MIDEVIKLVETYRLRDNANPLSLAATCPILYQEMVEEREAFMNRSSDLKLKKIPSHHNMYSALTRNKSKSRRNVEIIALELIKYHLQRKESH